jgi:hypothetical protein
MLPLDNTRPSGQLSSSFTVVVPKSRNYPAKTLIYPTEKDVVPTSAVDIQIPRPLFRFDTGVRAFLCLAVTKIWRAGFACPDIFFTFRAIY